MGRSDCDLVLPTCLAAAAIALSLTGDPLVAGKSTEIGSATFVVETSYGTERTQFEYRGVGCATLLAGQATDSNRVER